MRLSQDFHLLRTNVDWSQEAAARAAGVTDATVLALEQARTDPHLSTLVRLAFVFGCQVEVRLRRRPRTAAVLQDPRGTCYVQRS